MINIGRCFFDPKTPPNVLLDVIRELPSPLPNVKYDFDEERYVFKPNENNPDICITIKEKNHCPDQIMGKNGYVFSKTSNRVS